MNQFLLAFIAPVGSGKTHVARIVARKLGAVHVRTDDIRVALRKKGKSYSTAPAIAKDTTEKVLRGGGSVVLDFDAVRPKKQIELRRISERFGARLVLIHVLTPEMLVIKRLLKHRYSKGDLFKNAKQAIRVYKIRKALHRRVEKSKLQTPKQNLRFATGQGKPDFIVNNARPLAPQIQKIIRKLRN